MDTYEKKYKDALGWMREMYPCLTDSLREDAEHYFPELAESEDERIRKFICSIIDNLEPKDFVGVKKMNVLSWLEKQKENPKSADSIPTDCASNAKCEDRWHKVQDFLPDNGRQVLAQDCLGNRLLARYDGEGNWEVSVYDNNDYYCRNTITKWCEIPSEKQKEPENTSASTMIPSCWETEQKEQKPSLCDKCEKKSTCLDVKYDNSRAVEQCMNFVEIEQKPAEKDPLKDYEEKVNAEIGSSRYDEKDYKEPKEWKPRAESMEALLYAIEGKWEMIKPTSYLSRRLEDLYEGLVNTFNIEETWLKELSQVAYTEDIEAPRALKQKIEASMEQKPAEWSEDDKRILKGIIGKIDHDQTYGVSKAEMLSFLKRVHPQNPIIAVDAGQLLKILPKRQEWSKEEEMYLLQAIEILEHENYLILADKLRYLRPQPKAEWSEEDEKHIDICIKALKEWEMQDSEDFSTTISFLKSLRPHWKPSEEQMDAIDRCVDYLEESDNEDAEIMESLQEQLHKLM